MGLVRVAYALKKTVSEILQTETMARFELLLKHLPQVTFEDYQMQQAAAMGVLPATLEEFSHSEDTSLVSGREDEHVIKGLQSDLGGLRERVRQIKASKRLSCQV